jgi:hypothetical protein
MVPAGMVPLHTHWALPQACARRGSLPAPQDPARRSAPAVDQPRGIETFVSDLVVRWRAAVILHAL